MPCKPLNTNSGKSMSVDKAYNFRQATESISTSGILSEEQLELLGEEGYAAVINLLPGDSEYAVKREKDIVEAQGLAYHYIPVDFAAPSVSDYQAFARALADLSGRKLLLHCAANYRVSAFYAINAFLNNEISSTQAYAFIAAVWDLDEYPVWQEFVSAMFNGDNISIR